MQLPLEAPLRERRLVLAQAGLRVLYLCWLLRNTTPPRASNAASVTLPQILRAW